MSAYVHKPTMRKFLSNCRRLAGNDRGSVATIFAMASIPLVAATGVAIDYNRIVEAQVALQSLADRAAVTAAAYNGTEAQMESEGYTFLEVNHLDLHGLTYTEDVDVEGVDVEVELDATVEGTLLAVAITAKAGQQGGDGDGYGMGSSGILINATARYNETGGEPICMLALNKTADNAMYFYGTGDITATGCGFHSDSSSVNQALHLQGNATAVADFFHTVGGWQQTGSSGSFSEPPLSGKQEKGDPFNLSISCPTSSGSSVTPSGTSASPTSLSASVYNNITMQNNKVAVFTAGVHYIKGEIDLKNGSTLKGTDVTLVMCGSSARINMNGGTLQLQAPSSTSAEYRGFAVIGDSTATGSNTLQGGPSTYIRGIWYTPKADLSVGGNSDFNVNSSYFPIVADTITISGTGSVNIGMDFNAYGYGDPEELMTEKDRTVWLVQ